MYFDREEKGVAANMRRHRARNFEFIGVDGEGAGFGTDHRYVLLGVGNDYIENVDGIKWKEAFQFLYKCYEQTPSAAFVGFFLGYDFTQILKTLPEDRARMLLTDKGINARKRTRSGNNSKPFPVRYDGWEFDLLPGRRLQIRPQSCICAQIGKRDCSHKQFGWMYVCDSGPFWQCSLLSAIQPRNWNNPVISQLDFDTIEAGKANRSMTLQEYVENREKVIEYNRTENRALVAIMNELRNGFREIGVTLRRNQWFGPGQAAAAWFKKEGVPRRDIITESVPEFYLEASRESYFGGWFEIFSHGIVPGRSYEYDLNSAYPWVIANLPCLLHGRYDHGSGNPPVLRGSYVLIRARILGNDANIGSLLNRSKDGRIRRPRITEGWYWLHEIKAAIRAGLVSSYECREWVAYYPCDCENPVRGFRDLYEHRLAVGKNTVLGKSAKLVYNSGYGKFAQSVGSSPYGNWVYASLITAGCRERILDAIATHPRRSDAVLMVATDGIFFDSPHSGLPISDRLGEWDCSERDNLTLFKPGVYWDDKSRQKIAQGDPVGFKARGVNARDFARHIGEIDRKFLSAIEWPPEFKKILFDNPEFTTYIEKDWPWIEFPVGFSVTSAKVALMRNAWQSAGATAVNIIVRQDSDPTDKREGVYYDERTNRLRTTPLDVPYDEIVSTPYDKKYGIEDPFSQETQEWMGIGPDGSVQDVLKMYASLLIGKE